MPENRRFRSTLASLWFRLVSLAVAGLVFPVGLYLAQGKAQGWTFYLSAPEVVLEVSAWLIAASLAGIACGTLFTILLAPILACSGSRRERLAARAADAGVIVVMFCASRVALKALINEAGGWHGRAFLAAHAIVFLAALLVPRTRKELLASLSGLLKESTAKGLLAATGVCVVMLAGTEFVTRPGTTVKAAFPAPRPKSNILLVTFDALSADDMSLYGYRLPTTPRIDEFARQGTVFTNFFSASTFTTPSVATILTGRYPSESRVFQLQGRVRRAGENSLPHVMRMAGYATGAFVSNPYAYYLAQSLSGAYDNLPAPAFQPGGFQSFWDATRPLHQDSGLGSRIDEYLDLEYVWNLLGARPSYPSLRMRPETSFEQARQVLAGMPDGYFLWVHVMAPHNPYIPDSAERGRFLPVARGRDWEDESGGRWRPHYPPDQQSQVDQRRLLYDEYVATADRAFGAFLSQLQQDGKLANTTVIVSADHGESFQGGVYQHQSPYLTRPIVHVPLIIRTPDQQQGYRCAYTADQTALAPTILELAGQKKPEWMPGTSLAGWLGRDSRVEGQGMAFTEYLETNSVFAPLRHGTVGVIDGQYEYVLDIATQKGGLRPLREAEWRNLDRSAENPARAQILREAIYSRFPELPRKSQ